MTVLSLLSILPPVVSGGLLAHLVWPDRGARSLLLKSTLGIGLGLGTNSLVYFIYLSVFNRGAGFIFLQVGLAMALTALVILRERPAFAISKPEFKIGPTHVIVLITTAAFLVLTAIIYLNVSARKPHGAWDSWAIYNRSARMIYRSEGAWTDAFAPELYWYFHADYPPFLPLSIASAWNTIGNETLRVPMVISGAFLFGSLGLAFTGMHALKSMGQGALATIVLIGTSAYAEMGSKQVADIPLSFYILATGVLLLTYTIKEHRGLLLLAGLSSGLAAWTKNEGIPFAIISLIAMFIAFRGRLREVSPWFALGLALPTVILIYFKVFIAPAGDLFIDLPGQLEQALDVNNHVLMLDQFRLDLASLNNWWLLGLYAIIAGIEKPGKLSPALTAGFIILVLQLAGYYSILLISPHDLSWHLASLYRLLLQVQPLLVFLFFVLVRTPEAAVLEVDHAAGH